VPGNQRLNEWAGADLNRRHTDFQSVALPTELPALIHFTLHPNGQDYKKIQGKLRNYDYPEQKFFHIYRKQGAYKHAGKAISLRKQILFVDWSGFKLSVSKYESPLQR
jgi:hypothetical protein